MSLLNYNGITLPYPITTGFSQNVLYDPEGGVDWYCTQFDISVQAILNVNYLSTIFNSALIGAAAADNAALIMDAIRTTLLQPRRTLSFKCNGVELIPQQQGVDGTPIGSGTVDAQNGPKPQSCVITQLNSVTFLINYRIIAHYWENNNRNNSTLAIQNQAGGEVLYNRWTETVDIDNCMYSTRTRSGKFIIRSDNISGSMVDAFRTQMAVVGVPRGFLRESSSYTVTPDGLGMQYRVVDREVFKMPPTPAYTAEGYYRDQSVKPGAFKRYGEVYVKLRGSKDKYLSPQDKLLTAAVIICAKKLGLANDAGRASVAQSMILQEATITIGMYDNYVECYMRALFPVGEERKFGVVGFLDFIASARAFLCTTPYPNGGISDFQPPPTYKDRGTASILLQAAKYYDPSLQNNALAFGSSISSNNPDTARGSAKSQMNNGLKIGEAGVNPEA